MLYVEVRQNDIYMSYLLSCALPAKVVIVISPETMPTADPSTAWAHVIGEEMKREMMKIPPVQGLSQP